MPKCSLSTKLPEVHTGFFAYFNYFNQLLPKQQILDSKLKGFEDDNFKFDENGRKFSKRVENTVGKGRNCSIRAISPFPTVFKRLLLQTRTNKGLLGNG